VLELAGGGGRNLLTARVGYGAGQVFPGAVILRAGDEGDELTGSNVADVIVGGAGDDVVNASAGDDDVQGGAGADKLNGQDGDDALVGGPGPDSLSGGYGNDLLVADDRELDPVLNGGGGVDTASYDGGLDPVPAGVENRLPR
jgi:Ca2+-binding RTX toxin-like protein